MLRKIVIMLFAVILGVCFITTAQAKEKYKIGILQYSNEGFYVEGLDGLLEELKWQGLGEDKVDFLKMNAEGNKDNVNSIIQQFKGMNLDLLIALGTVSASVAVKEIQDIPIVFSTVFDPVGSGIVKSWKSSGNNATGTSTWVELKDMIEILRYLSPVKALAVFYNSEEKNSVLQLEAIEEIKGQMGYEVMPINVAVIEDVNKATQDLVGKADSIFITGSTKVGKVLDAILMVANQSKLPTVAHLKERVNQGVLLVVSSNNRRLGQLAGKKVAQILKNGAKPSDLPSETLSEYDIYINLFTAKQMGINIPIDLIRRAKMITE